MSFKYGYMTQRSAISLTLGKGREATGAKRGSRAASQCSPLPPQERLLAKREHRALEMLDSPASCDQVYDGNNQGDHQ
jgi:hypothetical protein